MTVFRVSKRAHARDLSGEGARRVGGRWNTPGNAMIYAAASGSLALLELLAHSTILPSDIVLITLRLPARIRVRTIEAQDLPAGWNSLPQSSAAQRFGDDFLREVQSLAIRVPSVIMPGEENILINPTHPQAKNIEIVSVEDLRVDPRLK